MVNFGEPKKLYNFLIHVYAARLMFIRGVGMILYMVGPD